MVQPKGSQILNSGTTMMSSSNNTQTRESLYRGDEGPTQKYLL